MVARSSSITFFNIDACTALLTRTAAMSME